MRTLDRRGDLDAPFLFVPSSLVALSLKSSSFHYCVMDELKTKRRLRPCCLSSRLIPLTLAGCSDDDHVSWSLHLL